MGSPCRFPGCDGVAEKGEKCGLTHVFSNRDVEGTMFQRRSLGIGFKVYCLASDVASAARAREMADLYLFLLDPLRGGVGAAGLRIVLRAVRGIERDVVKTLVVAEDEAMFSVLKNGAPDGALIFLKQEEAYHRMMSIRFGGAKVMFVDGERF